MHLESTSSVLHTTSWEYRKLSIVSLTWTPGWASSESGFPLLYFPAYFSVLLLVSNVCINALIRWFDRNASINTIILFESPDE